MKIVILLSEGRHPVSGRAMLPRLEAQAISLASEVSAQLSGLHCGQSEVAVHDALGHGLSRVDCLKVAEDADPLAGLRDHFSRDMPDLILAGRRGQGGEDSGLLPYALAEALGVPLMADVTSLANGDEPGVANMEQALPKGAKRRVTVRLPVVATVHPLAPAPVPFAYAQARRGVIERFEGTSEPDEAFALEERPRRSRPKLMREASSAGEGGESVFVNPDPDDAARMILDYLERTGVRSFNTNSRDL
ncbi:electron transfer flavoprotein subunit beta [Notoacmeibacter ruber]|uniref:Electron transfer flavoprotein subunit beta n=1 Tax=Notoacmeibacter ruber TaxID=2670375 RepID=A0A3L7JB75_9HYPH|nr:electron transfer flavoprotein subunit beta [Notoacmeibacter ruber]RLQ87893.1 electron transfer flavoprotein subunit beta [Notoacmeibacter ruber]